MTTWNRLPRTYQDHLLQSRGEISIIRSKNFLGVEISPHIKKLQQDLQRMEAKYEVEKAEKEMLQIILKPITIGYKYLPYIEEMLEKSQFKEKAEILQLVVSQQRTIIDEKNQTILCLNKKITELEDRNKQLKQSASFPSPPAKTHPLDFDQEKVSDHEMDSESTNSSVDDSESLCFKPDVLGEESEVSDEEPEDSGEDSEVSDEESEIQERNQRSLMRNKRSQMRNQRIQERIQRSQERIQRSQMRNQRIQRSLMRNQRIQERIQRSQMRNKRIQMRNQRIQNEDSEVSDEEPEDSGEDSEVSDEESEVSDEESDSGEESEVLDEESEVSDEEPEDSDEESEVSDEESDSGEEPEVSDEESEDSDEESEVSDEESDSGEEPEVSVEKTPLRGMRRVSSSSISSRFHRLLEDLDLSDMMPASGGKS
ncbi:unnamed protein product [Pleuronectes platessa]|uniref:Uncharacterized protein n=1 Tax=Pleuronectes platessa TaxID=8262 RepID=A0A9N7VJ63_PLEPL|nr:unnamed protein product [Pleuronectes platessa]